MNKPFAMLKWQPEAVEMVIRSVNGEHNYWLFSSLTRRVIINSSAPPSAPALKNPRLKPVLRTSPSDCHPNCSNETTRNLYSVGLSIRPKATDAPALISVPKRAVTTPSKFAL